MNHLYKTERYMVLRTWVEVWDYDHVDRLKAGYVSENGKDVLEQLSEIVPWEQWETIYVCDPMRYENKLVICRDCSSENYTYIKTRITNYKKFIFDESSNNQVVIQKRKSPQTLLQMDTTLNNIYCVQTP